MKIQNLTFLFLLFMCQSFAQTPDYGLYIRTFPLFKEYTSMPLEDGKAFEWKGKEFAIDFQVYVRNENVFGSICRLITDKQENIGLMFGNDDNSRRRPMLVIGNEVYFIEKDIKTDKWLPVRLTINPEKNTVTLHFDGEEISVSSQKTAVAKSTSVFFGSCPLYGYTRDAVSVNLKEISVLRNQQEIRRWTMMFHNGNTTYDELEQRPATAQNPEWLIDKCISWTPTGMLSFSKRPSITFDANSGSFYAACDNRNLYKYHCSDRTTDTIRVKGGEYIATLTNQLMYIPQEKTLLAYNIDEQLFATFNFSTRQWESKRSPLHEQSYSDNTTNYNPADSTFVSFGGYRQYRYNNELIIGHPWKPDTPFQRFPLDSIVPRYSSTSVIVDDTLYIFGGRGCPSGRQELSPHNYYDFYAVDLRTRHTRKLWEVETPPRQADFLPRNNMVYNPENQCFYFFCNEAEGVLRQINKHRAHFEDVALPLEKLADAQYVYTNLYFSPRQQKLYLASIYTNSEDRYILKVYEMNYPPITVKNVAYVERKSLKKSDGNYGMVILSVCLFLLIAGSGIYCCHRHKLRKKNMMREISPSELATDSAPAPPIETVEATEEITKTGIYLLGTFRVIDKSGEDITSLFTPTMKQLLVLLILYTGGRKTGISGQKMIQLLWSDKIEESAKNSRNVYLSKMRNLLDKIGDMQLSGNQSAWSIEFGEKACCDYQEALNLFQSPKRLREQDIQLLKVLLHGVILPDMDTEWTEPFKSSFTDSTINLLCEWLESDQWTDDIKLKMTDLLFQYDPVNEVAMRAKCHILYRQGKKGPAKVVFDKFCKEYVEYLGSNYKYSFNEIVR